MALTYSPLYSGSIVAMGITIGSLPSGSARQANKVDNTFTKYSEVWAQAKILGNSGGTTNLVNLWVVASMDGSTWTGRGSGNPDGVTGVDSAITLQNPSNLIQLDEFSILSSGTYYSNWVSIAAEFNNMIPPYWTIIVENQTGVTLAPGSAVYYYGANMQSLP